MEQERDNEIENEIFSILCMTYIFGTHGKFKFTVLYHAFEMNGDLIFNNKEITKSMINHSIWFMHRNCGLLNKSRLQ